MRKLVAGLLLAIFAISTIVIVPHSAEATAPTITKYGVLPTYGDVGYGTLFRFFLTYTDADNDSPSVGYPKATKLLYTWPVFTFIKNNSGDVNWSVGVAYYYDYSFYPIIGATIWSFKIKSGTDAEVTKTLSQTARLPSSPLPFNVYPANTNVGEKTFTFNYSSQWEYTPYKVNVTIDDISYSMIENNTGDTTYSDGKMFYKKLNLTAGMHNYSFQWHEISYLTPERNTGTHWLILYDSPDYNKWIIGMLMMGIIISVGMFIFIERKPKHP